MTDGLTPTCEEVSKPRYQVRRESQTNDLVNDNSMIKEIRNFLKFMRTRATKAFRLSW